MIATKPYKLTDIPLFPMADVRAMLRAERAARAPGKATQYSQTSSGKKRKADEQVPDDEDIHKRSKPFSGDSSLGEEYLEETSMDKSASLIQPEEMEAEPNLVSQSNQNTSADASRAVDEDEWAAFERDVATLPASPPRLNALNVLKSSAAISAAPLTSAELEERRKEELKQERVRREEDEEAEKEEASNRLAEEFEEMEALEERVRKLKEMREQLRQSQVTQTNLVEATTETSPANHLSETDEDSDTDLGDDWGLRRI